MKKGSSSKKFQAGKLFVAAVICLLMFSGISDTLAINTYVRDLKGLAVPVETYKVGAPLVALTFDVANSDDRVGDLLLQMRHAGIKATFFLTADWVRTHPDTAKEIALDGHEVGQSLPANLKVSELTKAQLQTELKKMDAAWKAAGLPDQKLFRAPDGPPSDNLAELIRERGEQMIAWSVNAVPASVSMQGDSWPNLVQSLQAGDILRMGANGSDVQSLPQLIQKVREAGYRFGTITSLQEEVFE